MSTNSICPGEARSTTDGDVRSRGSERGVGRVTGGREDKGRSREASKEGGGGGGGAGSSWSGAPSVSAEKEIKIYNNWLVSVKHFNYKCF